MNNVRGKRGGSGNRPSHGMKESHNISTSVLVAEAGKYYECSDIPDRSLTKRLHLRLWSNGYTLLKRGKPTDNVEFIRVTSKGKRRVEIEES